MSVFYINKHLVSTFPLLRQELIRDGIIRAEHGDVKVFFPPLMKQINQLSSFQFLKHFKVKSIEDKVCSLLSDGVKIFHLK